MPKTIPNTRMYLTNVDLYENASGELVVYRGDAEEAESLAELLRWELLHVQDTEGVRAYGRVDIVVSLRGVEC